MAQHTPTPWKTTAAHNPADCSVVGADGELVIAGEYDGYMTPFGCREEAVENAAYIVRCVNSHDALVDALEACKARLSAQMAEDTLDMAQAALALAKEA